MKMKVRDFIPLIDKSEKNNAKESYLPSLNLTDLICKVAHIDAEITFGEYEFEGIDGINRLTCYWIEKYLCSGTEVGIRA